MCIRDRADVEQLVRRAEAVHIKMEERRSALVLVDDGERRARDASAAAKACLLYTSSQLLGFADLQKCY